MSSDMDALGTVATGALLARTVEPHSGEARLGGDGACLNCGAMLAGAYCSQCGQKAHVHRTLAAFGHDLLHGVFHFDGKIWRTLPLLVWKPGELTRRYVHGERAKFVSPFALFLFSVFLMVAIFGWAGPTSRTITQPLSAAEARQTLAADQATLAQTLKELEAEKAAQGPGRQPWLDAELNRTRQLMQQPEFTQPQTAPRLVADRQLLLQQRRAEIELARLHAKRAEAAKLGLPTAKIDEDIRSVTLGTKFLQGAARTFGAEAIQADRLKVDLGIQPLNDLIRHGLENPQLMLYKIQSSAYKFSWALIPISVPFVWLLFFWRRDLHLFDHAVFVTYSISFMTLLMTACVLAIQMPALEAIGAFALVLYPPVHIYRQLRGAYALGRPGALLRSLLLVSFSVTALLLFAGFILALGLSS